MFGNDPQCRAPNSGRRKVWSIEGIKQPLHLVRRPGRHHWADITLGGHQHIGRTSRVGVDISLGGHYKRNVVFIVGGLHSWWKTREQLESSNGWHNIYLFKWHEAWKSFRAGFCGKPESWEDKPIRRDLPNLDVAAGDPVRTAIEKYCKSRRIRTESRQVAETTIHDERELWRLGLQLVTGTLGKCTLGLWYWTIGRFGTGLVVYSGSWALAALWRQVCFNSSLGRVVSLGNVFLIESKGLN